MLQGHQTWKFENKPVIVSTGTVGGPFEAKGQLTEDFDLLHDDLWMGQDSYEKAQKVLIEESISKAIEKAELRNEDIQFMFAGDLINQITPSSFAGRTLAIPYLGLFGACSTSMEGLALASFIVNAKGAERIIAASSSHNAATEKQFRYPTEYGGQKPPTAQWTVTAAGAALVCNEGDGPVVTSATIGKVIDMGLSDPFNMGGAMAPAAADTIVSHFRDLDLPADHYDLVVTGDLAKIGLPTAKDLIEQKGLVLPEGTFQDCGLMIYKDNQPVLAGASGAGCSASVTYGHLLNRIKKGELKRILVVATGALLSPMSFQQKETIPCIAHAVSIEAGGESL
ncbi:stage V sporulation protein AD [Halalkalibacter wakoensis JCM 9140]|uniref:Stage V sporulation protein AD n=1 Tax=Halalkalibacter wakoensis JCM 9140 TaxID=1236970 RepID=W4Q0P7_9BACI|nr:stage V sporulation protein AD [Halalkalibacter wakoensis]GAE25656.1 stage V sporulation protein AD [Halalkalibacter wakoensis JCM 9140]